MAFIEIKTDRLILRPLGLKYLETTIQYADTKLSVKHFIAHCDAENVASYKIMEKLGMVRTCECGGRKNRRSENTSLEYQYELFME